MQRAIRWAGTIFTIGILGCSEPTPPADTVLTIHAVSPTQIAGLPGEDLKDLPAVRVSSLKNDPAVGLKVTFSLIDPDGASTQYVGLTDNNGVARLNSWRLDKTGQYRVSVSTDRSATVEFGAFARGNIVARYFAINSRDTTSASRPLMLLYDDGSYFLVPFSDPSGYPTGKYRQQDPTTLKFYIDPLDETAELYRAREFLLAIGRLREDHLLLDPDDPDGSLEFVLR